MADILVYNEICTDSDRNLCRALAEANTTLLLRRCSLSDASKSRLQTLTRPQLFTFGILAGFFCIAKTIEIEFSVFMTRFLEAVLGIRFTRFG